MKRTYTTEQIISKQQLQALRDAVKELLQTFLRECPDAEDILKCGRNIFASKKPQPTYFYKTLEGTWGYWNCHFVSNALATMCCLREAKFLPKACRMGVVQLGGGPAEDLIGLLEHLRLQSQPPMSLHYLSIDEGNWEPHLEAVNTIIIPRLFPNVAVDVQMQQVAFGEWHEGHDLRWLKKMDFVLVIVANTLVTCKKQSRISELHNMLARLAGQLSSTTAHWLLIEPTSCKKEFLDIISNLFRNHVNCETISYRHSPQVSSARTVHIDRVFLGPQVLSVSTPPS
jgi:hypothetical protein